MRITVAYLFSAFCHLLALFTAVAVLSSPCTAGQPAIDPRIYPVPLYNPTPLITVSFSLRYQKGEDLIALLKNKEHLMLSKRGSVVVDKRTNILYVQDTEESLREISKFIKQVDVPGVASSPK